MTGSQYLRTGAVRRNGNWIGAFGRWVYCRFIVTCQKWRVMVAGGAPPGGRWCRY
ncbi:hypothetical protein U1Q18_051152, partial [Sarracenia purpurea var. burkii]